MEQNIKLLTAISKTMKILYVEDNEEARGQTVKMLENYFSDITVVSDGEEGLNLFKKNSYHIIFTDIEMPVMNGISMIGHIRKLNKEIPIVILSAHNDEKYFLETIKAGIDGYILKPYYFEQIVEVITKIIMKFDIKLKSKSNIHLVGGYIWSKEHQCLMKDDKKVKLSKNEIKLLKILALSIDTPISNQEIEAYIFNDNLSQNKRLRSLVSRMKLKLDQSLIEANYGRGYTLKVSSESI
jgi:DNA-binding response OmpR family regulator